MPRSPPLKETHLHTLQSRDDCFLLHMIKPLILSPSNASISDTCCHSSPLCPCICCRLACCRPSRRTAHAHAELHMLCSLLTNSGSISLAGKEAPTFTWHQQIPAAATSALVAFVAVLLRELFSPVHTHAVEYARTAKICCSAQTTRLLSLLPTSTYTYMRSSYCQ